MPPNFSQDGEGGKDIFELLLTNGDPEKSSLALKLFLQCLNNIQKSVEVVFERISTIGAELAVDRKAHAEASKQIEARVVALEYHREQVTRDFADIRKSFEDIHKSQENKGLDVWRWVQFIVTIIAIAAAALKHS